MHGLLNCRNLTRIFAWSLFSFLCIATISNKHFNLAINIEDALSPFPRQQMSHALKNTSGDLTIPIGTIFNADDILARSAFRLAISMHNGSQNKSFKVQQRIDIPRVSDSYEMANALCQQMKDGIFLVYGMKHPGSSDLLDAITNRFHMPYITSSMAPLQEGEFFHFNMRPDFTEAILDLIIYFKWDQAPLHYIYDSDEGLNRVSRLLNMYRDREENSHIDIGAKKIKNIKDAHADLKDVDHRIIQNYVHHTYKEAYIILDLSSQDAYESILKQISEVGMNRKGYFYLLATTDFSKLNFYRFLHGGVNLTGFDIVLEENPSIQNFKAYWGNASKVIYTGAGEPITAEVAMAVDGFHVIVDTFMRMLKDQPTIFQTRRGKLVYNNYTQEGIPCYKVHPFGPEPKAWMHGFSIANYIQRTRIEGLTGLVEFDHSGNRANFTVQVSSVHQAKGPKRIGIWKPNGAFSNLGDQYPFPNMTGPDSTLIITTIRTKPFFMYKEDQTKDGKPLVGNDKYEGYIVDLASEMRQFLDRDYILKLVEDQKYGIQDKNGSWNGMIGELLSGKAQMAMADLTITYDREVVVDFTKPFMEIGISIMIKKPEIERPGVFSFLQPLGLEIWMCIIIAYGAVSIGLFMVSRCSPYEWKRLVTCRGVEYENDFSVKNSFWFATGALMLQGSDACPRSISGRIIGTVWWFFVLIIISTYTANLAAFLTVERIVTPIENVDDLASQTDIKYGTVDSGTSRTFFEQSKVSIYVTMWNFMSSHPSVMAKSTDEGIERVRNSKGKYAFLVESSVNDYTNSREPCDTMKVGRNLNSKGYGVATPKRSPYRDVVNLGVLEMKENGVLHKLKQRWYQDKSQCFSDIKESTGKSSLSLSNVAGVFYILICGLVTAVVLGAVEFLVKRFNLSPKMPPSYMHGTETATSFIDSMTERENGEAACSKNSHSSNQGVRTYFYGQPQVIGVDTIDDRNTHTDV